MKNFKNFKTSQNGILTFFWDGWRSLGLIRGRFGIPGGLKIDFWLGRNLGPRPDLDRWTPPQKGRFFQNFDQPLLATLSTDFAHPPRILKGRPSPFEIRAFRQKSPAEKKVTVPRSWDRFSILGPKIRKKLTHTTTFRKKSDERRKTKKPKNRQMDPFRRFGGFGRGASPQKIKTVKKHPKKGLFPPKMCIRP